MANYYVDSNKDVSLLAGATDNHYNANISFDNINDTAKNIANWSSNITNCITHISQDIKLELNNGTVTLKAGSKLRKPNGFEADGTTPKFDTVVTTQDVTGLGWFSTTSLKNQMVFARTDGLEIDSTVYTSSGTSYPSSPSNGDRCYRTDLNLLYTFRTSNNQWILEDCLPIAIVQPSSTEAGKTSSIDQVFNGFGYIGSTVFALPGVKGLAPDVRNADGSLKSIEFETKTCLTYTTTDGVTGDYYIQLRSNFISRASVQPESWRYDDRQNIIIWNNNTVLQGVCLVGKMTMSSGKISNFKKPQVFHALDYNDTSYISSQAMPSDKYIDLTLLASGSTYTAPANGWFESSKMSGTNSSVISAWCIENSYYTAIASTFSTGNTGIPHSLRVEVKKGQKLYYLYTVTGQTNYFRFIYAEGEV